MGTAAGPTAGEGRQAHAALPRLLPVAGSCHLRDGCCATGTGSVRPLTSPRMAAARQARACPPPTNHPSTTHTLNTPVHAIPALPHLRQAVPTCSLQQNLAARAVGRWRPPGAFARTVPAWQPRSRMLQHPQRSHCKPQLPLCQTFQPRSPPFPARPRESLPTIWPLPAQHPVRHLQRARRRFAGPLTRQDTLAACPARQQPHLPSS